MGFGKNLRIFRERLGWSQRELAEAIVARGVKTSTSSVGWAEKDLVKSPKLALVAAAADALGVSIGELMGEAKTTQEMLTIRLRLKPGARISDGMRKQAERIMQSVIEELSEGRSDAKGRKRRGV
jgi:transcriptional regulator with XRE-family HTH domain